MSNILFAINAIFPLILSVLAGYLLKRAKLITREIAGGMNRLVFRLFLPCMLFLNIYNIENLATLDLTYIWFTLGITAILFVLAIFVTKWIGVQRSQRGVLVQASFRSNYALVGIPLAESLFGQAGTMVATLLSAFIIPLYNILAVICLTVYSDRAEKKINVKKILLEIANNPLIQAIAIGGICLAVRALLQEFQIDFRIKTDIPFVYKTLDSLSKVATPLALVVLGAQFEFSAIASLKKQILFGVIMRALVVPVLGLGTAYLLGCFEGAHFAAFSAVFVTPIAVSSVPMAQEMGADSALAGQLVVWTTLVSALTLFISSGVLKALGVF